MFVLSLKFEQELGLERGDDREASRTGSSRCTQGGRRE